MAPRPWSCRALSSKTASARGRPAARCTARPRPAPRTARRPRLRAGRRGPGGLQQGAGPGRPKSRLPGPRPPKSSPRAGRPPPPKASQPPRAPARSRPRLPSPSAPNPRPLRPPQARRPARGSRRCRVRPRCPAAPLTWPAQRLRREVPSGFALPPRRLPGPAGSPRSPRPARSCRCRLASGRRQGWHCPASDWRGPPSIPPTRPLPAEAWASGARARAAPIVAVS